MISLKKKLISLLRGLILPIMVPALSEPVLRKGKTTGYYLSRITKKNCTEGHHVRIDFPFDLRDVLIGDYTYISVNSCISLTEIGKFCSIGPHFFCGWGIHPTDGLSTSPLFYTSKYQNSFAGEDRLTERKKVIIGNDVFIGANVTVLDGISIGDGAVIGAGAVVSKNIPPYAIAVGSPVEIIKYRFDEETIQKLMEIKWWDFEENQLKDVSKLFSETDAFIRKYYIS